MVNIFNLVRKIIIEEKKLIFIKEKELLNHLNNNLEWVMRASL